MLCILDFIKCFLIMCLRLKINTVPSEILLSSYINKTTRVITLHRVWFYVTISLLIWFFCLFFLSTPVAYLNWLTGNGKKLVLNTFSLKDFLPKLSCSELLCVCISASEHSVLTCRLHHLNKFVRELKCVYWLPKFVREKDYEFLIISIYKLPSCQEM